MSIRKFSLNFRIDERLSMLTKKLIYDIVIVDEVLEFSNKILTEIAPANISPEDESPRT